MRRKGGRAVGALGLFVLAGMLAAALITGASAASPCAGSRSAANALTTTSPSGEKVYGSECADLIVVTSPAVKEVVGGAGNDVIFANPDVEVVEAGAGDDVIYGDLPEKESEALAEEEAEVGGPVYHPLGRGATASAIATASKACEAEVSCYGGDGSQELIGSSGNDKIFGQRGDDTLKGESGNDQLFGGVGDEPLISGGGGNDLLSGGLGKDYLNGNQESDLVRGDGTTDTIEDTGASGTDTLSFANAVTPGFHGTVSVSGFPADSASEERGVNVHLDGTQCEGEFEACNNDATNGGGFDNIVVSGFENVIGSPFADYIVGSSGANRIDGGGGADVIYGKGGNDEIYGAADGDYINGEEGTDTIYGGGGEDNCIGGGEDIVNECSGTAEKVVQRNRSKISVGFMVTSPPATLGWDALYLTGSTGNDHVKATYTSEAVTFTTEGESAEFDTSAEAGCAYEATKVTCTLPKPLDAITMAGLAGNDTLTLSGFPELTTPVLLGEEGNDTLTTENGTEDMLVDGSGNDTLSSGNYDDALINNAGIDVLEGGMGNDLLLSAVLCEGDTINGAKASEGDSTAVNNASWAKLPVSAGEKGVVANLGTGSERAGNEAGPKCSAGETDKLLHIDDLEGSNGIDKLVGNEDPNNILGHLGKDELVGQGGADNLEANERPDNTAEADTVTGGNPTTKPGDTCRIDKGVDSASGCETKNEV